MARPNVVFGPVVFLGLSVSVASMSRRTHTRPNYREAYSTRRQAHCDRGAKARDQRIYCFRRSRMMTGNPSKQPAATKSVGFVVKIPADYFRKIERFVEDGWEDDDRDLYEHMTVPAHHWRDLQGRDPEILVTDDGGQ
ncbi:hypothetical protein AUEXF2481DRAFT_164019 [Aureobasidium subglaciale EXF-2481]|uniref:Uncharacterized protein n=1 Tax=Aureobasidium subglaciale (strain EXF-2481) TaxID=1043005 RepID=A0A074YXJ6_AURSE|nr:uncharacterized protein AUEXF2481DRAFT_164019 [Aureobasidium subglaciale EXF-2481]KER00870.1 hypothetical protein AUEXF2481DRAFT_164019 [Aureobasidium subglaciale EXF-2481]